jgi:ribosomal protein S1
MPRTRAVIILGALREVVTAGDRVKVRVVSVDAVRGRIGLSTG